MPTTTPNLGLTKDYEGEPYNLTRINANSDRMDAFAGEALTDTMYDTTGTPALIKKRKIAGVETPVTIETPDTTPTEGSKHLITSDAVHAALGSKQDELTQEQLAAANSGITAEKLTADEAALAELTAKERQNENNILSAYGGIVGKNAAKENDFTATLSKIVYCNPITGTIHISAANVSSTDTDSTICRILLYYTDGTVSSNNLSLSRGSNISFDVNIRAKIIERIVIYASDSYNNSIGDTVTVSDLMICTQADYAADPTYQPYIMSNVELTAAIQALQNGTRSAPALAKSEPEEIKEKETGEEETR